MTKEDRNTLKLIKEKMDEKYQMAISVSDLMVILAMVELNIEPDDETFTDIEKKIWEYINNMVS